MTYEEAEAAVFANSDDSDAWFVLGTLQEAAGDTTQSRVSYRRVLVLDPLMQEALTALIRLQEERVLNYAYDEFAKEDAEAVPSAALFGGVARLTYARWLLLVLLLLSLVLAVLLYRNSGTTVLMPSAFRTTDVNATASIISTKNRVGGYLDSYHNTPA
jgi:hypothetical protein